MAVYTNLRWVRYLHLYEAKTLAYPAELVEGTKTNCGSVTRDVASEGKYEFQYIMPCSSPQQTSEHIIRMR